jgi:transketolase
VGENGDVVGLDRFGESAPAGDLFRLFGITAEMVAVRATRLVGAASTQREAVTP